MFTKKKKDEKNLHEKKYIKLTKFTHGKKGEIDNLKVSLHINSDRRSIKWKKSIRNICRYNSNGYFEKINI